MQTVWIKRGGSSRLWVVAMGWAGEDTMIRHLDTGDADLLCLYDYRDLTLPEGLAAEIEAYSERRLLAWSFGVWAAAHLFSELPVRWDETVAVGGTPSPVDPEYGIPPRAFALTLRGIEAAGTLKFLERMCGDRLRDYLRHRSTRPLEEICDELRKLGEVSASHPARSFRWSRAIIGGGDLIFPPDAQQRCWESLDTPCTVVPDMPHYPFYDPLILSR